MKGFKDLDVSYIDTISSLLNEEESEYDKVFKAALNKFGISSPDELGSDEEKKKFFNHVDSQYVSKDEKNESYASDYKKHAAQHPEQDMTEEEDWREGNEYGDAAKNAVDESRFFEKKFPTRGYKIIDNADIYNIMTRGSRAPTYYEAFSNEVNLLEKAESEEESGSAEPTTQSGLDVANAEPNSAVGFRNDPIPPKRVDVLCDVDYSDVNNPKKTYRLWCQYPLGNVSIHPAPHEPGLKNVEDLALFKIPGSEDAIKHALDVPKNRPEHRGVNESKKKSKINEKVVGLKFTIYHNSFTSAINNAIKSAEDKGYEITEDERFDKIAVGPGRPKPGKTNRFTISLMKNGKPTKEALHIQVYGMESGKYELNAYIS